MLFSSISNILALAALFTTAHAHARVTVPKTRGTGSHQIAACGSAFVKKLESDKAGPIENSLQYLSSNTTTPECNPFLCRSYLYADSANALKLSANSNLTFHVDIIAGHRPGYSNVSVVDTTSNTVVAELKKWANWPCPAEGAEGACTDDRDFSVTIPKGLKGKCSSAGKCVIQWYWYAIANKQTYESCVDFVAT